MKKKPAPTPNQSSDGQGVTETPESHRQLKYWLCHFPEKGLLRPQAVMTIFTIAGCCREMAKWKSQVSHNLETVVWAFGRSMCLHTTNSLTKAPLKNTLETGHPSMWLAPSTPNIWQHDSTIHSACLNRELLSCCKCILHFWLLATSKVIFWWSRAKCRYFISLQIHQSVRVKRSITWTHFCSHTVTSWRNISKNPIKVVDPLTFQALLVWSPFLLAHHGGDHLNSVQFSTREGTSTMNLCQPPIRNFKIPPFPTTPWQCLGWVPQFEAWLCI